MGVSKSYFVETSAIFGFCTCLMLPAHVFVCFRNPIGYYVGFFSFSSSSTLLLYLVHI
ncbi:hypothetical protein CPB84DRAFT_1520371 [Gymnopilus junonius]|uniref:Uncharacterized protein n=1 Tax=Gymnopilus junonius TaxID=109634 RepID=A0A9P5TSI8_GYMJU|nr:hypothetical protein CPB84DRAFT_1520371 [Gymnopilus junonius]